MTFSDVIATDSIARIVEQDIIDILSPYEHIVSSVLTNVGAGQEIDTLFIQKGLKGDIFPSLCHQR
ncbi:hypothetical protein N9Y89_00710 [bacterium]|nr:hypothetical protein [bacterium]